MSRGDSNGASGALGVFALRAPSSAIALFATLTSAALELSWALALAGALALPAALAAPAAAAPSSTADLDAVARSEGNRREDAVALGRALFSTVWPAQVLKVRIDGTGGHEVAGLMLSGVKFHQSLDERGFTAEIVSLVKQTFAASRVEEVDIWATQPIPYDRREPVSGDYAQPTDRIVYAVTVRRDEAGFEARIAGGQNVFWAPDFRARLAGGGVGGPLPGSANSLTSPST